MKIFTNKSFFTEEIKNAGRITWYSLQKHIQDTYPSVLAVEFINTTSSAGDWDGLIFQRRGKSCVVIPFSQTNIEYNGFRIDTGDVFATLPARLYKDKKEEVISTYCSMMS